MLHCKCPRCRRGNLYVGGAYQFGSRKILDKCAHCGLHYEIEPGYFYAAMYVSYALNVAEAVTLGVGTYILTHNTTAPWLYIGVILAGCFILAPLNFRYARVILLFLLSPKIHYQPYLDTDDPAVNV